MIFIATHFAMLICNIITCFYFCKTINNFSIIKDTKVSKFISFVGLFFVSNVIIFPSDITNVIYTMVGFIALMILFYKDNYIKNISAVMIFYPIVVSLNLLTKNFFTYLYCTNAWLGDNVMTILELSTNFFAWFLIYHFSKDRINNINKYVDVKTWIMINIICLAPFISIISIVINTPFQNSYQIYPIGIACIITSFGMIFLIEYIVKSTKIKLEHQNFRLEQSYYKELDANQQKIRKINHDINNHFSIIYSFLENNNTEGAKNYFKELSNSFDVHNKTFCKNSIVNAVINSKYNFAIKNKIDCFFNIDINEDPVIDDVDLCSIFANTLDNAIEACQKIEDISKRNISLKARCDKGYFSFCVVNTYNGHIKFKNGKYTSTKQNPKNHGIGISNIEDIVKKYKGTLNITYSDCEFTILVIIKI